MPLTPKQHFVSAYGGSVAGSAAELIDQIYDLPMVKVVSLAAAGVALVAVVEEVDDLAEDHPPCYPPRLTQAKMGRWDQKLDDEWSCPTCNRRYTLTYLPTNGNAHGRWKLLED